MNKINKPIIDLFGNKFWYLDGTNTFHREDGPACEYSTGDKLWYINDKLHREDGPACEHVGGYKAWYVNGNLHRLDGPARDWGDGRKQYWINNTLYDSLEEGLMDLALK